MEHKVAPGELFHVGVPTLTRDLKDKDLWMKPVAAKFHFKLVNGKLTEVTEPMAEAIAPKQTSGAVS